MALKKKILLNNLKNQLTRGVSSFHVSELTSPLDTLLDKRQQDVELVETKLCKPNYHSKN